MSTTKLASLKLPPALLVKLRALRRPHQAIAGVIEELLEQVEQHTENKGEEKTHTS